MRMGERYHFVALDLGAESGRGELVTLGDGKVTMEEIHRWPNRPVRMAGTLTWDLPFLLAEVVAAIRAAVDRGLPLASIGIDTWGVDFGLLGADGKLLGNPVHYRDGRTAKIHEYSGRIMSNDAIFAATGYEPWAISSLFQLLAMQRDSSPMLAAADSFLNMPDLFNYFLTGRKCNELSVVNTSNLLGADCQWATGVMDAFGLPRRLFNPLIAPATVLGPMLPELREATGAAAVPVIASCGHDTSAAVAAIPGEGEDWAFVSCGTWSILGTLIEKPVTDLACLRQGFTNEYTLGGWYLARNIIGLWPVQELRRKWHSGDDAWDYPRMAAEAAKAASGPLVDVADPSLLAPADMEEALAALIRKTHQPASTSRGQLVRCALESLALEYDFRLRAMGELTGRPARTLYLVGGGTANTLLCQLTADACGMTVHAGADQCSSLGNALCQAVAMGILKDPAEIRRVMAHSFEMTTYRPADQTAWQARRRQYAQIRSA
jgi:rhamnulokinase